MVMVNNIWKLTLSKPGHVAYQNVTNSMEIKKNIRTIGQKWIYTQTQNNGTCSCIYRQEQVFRLKWRFFSPVCHVTYRWKACPFRKTLQSISENETNKRGKVVGKMTKLLTSSKIPGPPKTNSFLWNSFRFSDLGC